PCPALVLGLLLLRPGHRRSSSRSPPWWCPLWSTSASQDTGRLWHKRATLPAPCPRPRGHAPLSEPARSPLRRRGRARVEAQCPSGAVLHAPRTRLRGAAAACPPRTLRRWPPHTRRYPRRQSWAVAGPAPV